MNEDDMNITRIIHELVNRKGRYYDELYALLEESEQAIEHAAWAHEPVQFRIYYNRQSDSFYNELYRDPFFAEFLPDQPEQILRRDTWTYTAENVRLNMTTRTLRIDDDIFDILDSLLANF